MRGRRAAAAIGLLLPLLAPGLARAHRFSRAYVELTARGRAVTLRLQGSPRALAPLLAVAPEVRPIPELYRARRAVVLDDIRRYLTLANARGARCRAAGPGRLVADDQEVVATLRYRCPPGEIQLRYDLLFQTDPDHRAFVSVQVGERSRLVVLDRRTREVRFSPRYDLMEEAGIFFRLGVHHIASGYDHILFLLALILVAPIAAGGRPGEPHPVRPGLLYLLKVVTAFTVAHSLTLALAALDVVRVPGRPVEAAIALSIGFVALENITGRGLSHRWWLVFGFGLIHGLGFARVLAETGLPPGLATPALVAFNLGVEAGQIAVVGLLYPVIHQLAGRPPGVARGALIAALVAGVLGVLHLAGVRLSFWPAVIFGLLLLALAGVRRLGYGRVVMQGGSAVIAAFAALWLVERVADVQLLGGLLG